MINEHRRKGEPCHQELGLDWCEQATVWELSWGGHAQENSQLLMEKQSRIWSRVELLSIHSSRTLNLLYAASYTSLKKKKKKDSIPPDCFAKEHGKLQRWWDERSTFGHAHHLPDSEEPVAQIFHLNLLKYKVQSTYLYTETITSFSDWKPH